MVVVPEKKLEVKHEVDDEGMVNIECRVSEVFPQPNITLEWVLHCCIHPILIKFNWIIFRFNENDVYRKLNDVDIQSQKDDNDLYTVAAKRKVQISEMLCPTTIRCSLNLLETNYTRRVETIFYGDEAPY